VGEDDDDHAEVHSGPDHGGQHHEDQRPRPRRTVEDASGGGEPEDQVGGTRGDHDRGRGEEPSVHDRSPGYAEPVVPVGDDDEEERRPDGQQQEPGEAPHPLQVDVDPPVGVDLAETFDVAGDLAVHGHAGHEQGKGDEAVCGDRLPDTERDPEDDGGHVDREHVGENGRPVRPERPLLDPTQRAQCPVRGRRIRPPSAVGPRRRGSPRPQEQAAPPRHRTFVCE